jgi:membrane protease YdiL (CAAX protease family)
MWSIGGLQEIDIDCPVDRGIASSRITTLTAENKSRVKTEISIVLALSLGASAVYSIVSIISRLTAETRLADQTATINRQLSDREWLDFSYQFLGIALGLAPVALVLFLLWEKSRSPFELIGFDLRQPARDILRGTWLAAIIGIPGLGLYVAARQLGISAEVIPADLASYWWTIPMLLFAAVKASLLEEIIVVGYLFHRLDQLGFSKKAQILFSATLRATYHLYQGFWGFIGNFVMGLVFGYLYQRFGRVMPLIVAHFLLDAAIFVGYSALKDVLTFL